MERTDTTPSPARDRISIEHSQVSGAMTVASVKELARLWVDAEASRMPGFAGAFIAGSANWLPDDTPLPCSSDFDVKILLDKRNVPGEPNKHAWHGVVIDVSFAPFSDVRSAEAVLGNYYTAGHIARNGIIADPTGHLRAIQPQVEREYAHRRWVRARCDHAHETTVAVADSFAPTAPLPDRIFTWLLTLCATTHIALVADLRNPTIRKSLVTFKEVMQSYGHVALHERALGVLGSAHMKREDTESLLASCTDAFDAAMDIITTPFFGSSNISELGRPMAIGGIGEMIRDGQHREAAYWIGVIQTWCQKALNNEAPADMREKFDPGYRDLLGALGIDTDDDVATRMERTRALIPETRQPAYDIIASSPAITS